VTDNRDGQPGFGSGKRPAYLCLSEHREETAGDDRTQNLLRLTVNSCAVLV
jgi:hypothetical protein